MVFLQPEKGGRDQEGLNFVPAIVKDTGSPIGVIALAGIGIFIGRTAVKFKKTKEGVKLTVGDIPEGPDYIIELITK